MAEPQATRRGDVERSDEELMRAFVAGDAPAFDALLERYRGRVYGAIRGIVRDDATAEDVFQEVFLKVIRSGETFDKGRPFAPWLFTVAYNVSMDALRRAAKAPAADASDRLAAPVAGNPERRLMDRERREAVLRAIEELPEPQRRVVILRAFSEMSFAEIAEALNRPLNTVLSMMNRSLQRLRSVWPEGKDYAETD